MSTELKIKYKNNLMDTISKLVQIPSRSSIEGGEEGMIQSLVAKSMKDTGARVRTFEANDVPEFFNHQLCHGPDRQYKGRPTVIGEIGHRDAPALLVLAHSDTVQITSPEKWSVDPFSGQISNGKVYGLGSGDDKWGVAAILTIMSALMEKGELFERRVIFTSTIDEENGVGNGLLLLMLAGIKAKTALYLDGADGNISIGNMGGSHLHLRPTSSTSKKKLNNHALMLEEACKKMNKKRRHLYDHPFYENNNWTKEHDPVFKLINDKYGNVFDINFYIFPEEEKLSASKRIEEMVAGALGKDSSEYKFTYDELWFEPAFVGVEVPLIKQLSTSYQNIIGKPAKISIIPKQDAFILTNHADIPTISFGISRSEGPGQFHEVDENIDIEFAWKCCCVVFETIYKWLNKEKG